jgi:hypothetical protein
MHYLLIIELAQQLQPEIGPAVVVHKCSKEELVLGGLQLARRKAEVAAA